MISIQTIPRRTSLFLALALSFLTQGCVFQRWSLFPTSPFNAEPLSTPSVKMSKPLEESNAPSVVSEKSHTEPSMLSPATSDEADASASGEIGAEETVFASPEQGEQSEEADETGEDDGEEGEPHITEASTPNGPRYSQDVTDELLAEMFTNSPEQLGSLSVGFVDAGRLMNGVQFPQGAHWTVVQPEKAWATQETIDYMTRAITRVRQQYPDAPLLRVNQISNRDGGWMRPHKSHQNGRDVDLGFYYPTNEPIRVREREKYIDVEKNWALVKALVMETDVQFILVDRRIISVLYAHALKAGEDPAWLESIFKPGPNSLVRHARRHRDHFHVRFYNPRAQELGRRVAPLLAKKPETNIAFHRIRSGDSLSRIAAKYGSSVKAIRTANKLKSDFVRVGVVVSVPLRKPCTSCPVPPPVDVPPRRLPPDGKSMAAST